MNGLLGPVTANRNMLAQALKSRQKGPMELKPVTPQGLLDNAAMATSPVPLLGDVLGLAADANRFANEPESRTPLNFGLAALGLIPFLPPLVSAGLGKFAQSQGKTLGQLPTGPARNQAGAIVYHGSPHKFDAFDSSKIGTGEGAQAYGHGLYFAENPAVAKSYMDAGGSGEWLTVNKGGKELYGDALTPKHLEAIKFLESGARDAGQFKHNTAYYAKKYTQDPEVIKLIDDLKDAKIGYKKHSALYKVDLPDEAIAKMLDWDKPLSQQAPEVKSALEKKYAGINSASERYSAINGRLNELQWNGGLDSPEWNNLVSEAKAIRQKFGLAPDDTGEDLYKQLTTVGPNKSLSGDRQFASDQLKGLGIPGIRYLDGGSRGVGHGTSNYVVFPGNEGLLKILERQ